jgi:hypothetical protein
MSTPDDSDTNDSDFYPDSDTDTDTDTDSGSDLESEPDLDESFGLDENVKHKDDDKLRVFILKVSKLLGFDLNNLTNVEPPDSESCVKWLKSSVVYMRLAGYIALTTMSLALYEPSSDLWPLIPAFLFAVHSALQSAHHEKGRKVMDTALILSLAALLLKEQRTIVPSDEELGRVCIAQTGEFHCEKALEELRATTTTVMENAAAFQSNLLTDKKSPVNDALPVLTTTNPYDLATGFLNMSEKATAMASLTSFFYSIARKRSVWETVTKKGWFHSFYALASFKTLMQALKVTTMSELMHTLSYLSVQLQGVMRFVVVGLERGFSTKLYEGIVAKAARGSSLLTYASALDGETMARVLVILLFLFMLLYYTVRYLIKR